MKIGDKIRNLRLQRGWSQTQVAKGLNCRQTTVSSWENGTNEPSIATIKEIASYFHVPPQSLLPFEYTKDDETQIIAETILANPKLKVLFDRATHLSDDDLDAVASVMRAISRERDA